jgi:hypothetical protein
LAESYEFTGGEMKTKFAMVVTAAAVLALSTFLGTSLGPLRAQTANKPAGGFDRMRSLVGEWQGTDESGKPVTSAFRVVSNGTALEETFQSENDNQMVTMYTPDGSRVALTHYCSKGNQPKMETPAETATTDEFAFGFTGAANLASPEDAHLHRLVLQIVDAEHFTETWTIHEKGRDTKKTFHFTRKK